MTDTKAKIDQLLNLLRSLAFDIIDGLQEAAPSRRPQERLSPSESARASDLFTKPEAKPPVPRLLWSSRQAAKSLGISERTLWSLTKQEQIRCIRIGRIVRYDPADLRTWINRKKSENDSAS